MRLSFSVFLLVNAFALLNPSLLPAQDAKSVVAPSGAGHAEQRKTLDDPQSLLDLHGEMSKGIATNTTTNKLKAKIMTALERSYVTSAFKIAVTAPGHVVIDGEVQSYWDKQNVFAIVACVPGVKAISNRLNVQTDDVAGPIIMVELEEYLKRMRAIKEPGKIKVAARSPEGEVILGGTVKFPYEKKLAEEIAAWHRGVRKVDNQIEVLSMNKDIPDTALARAIQDMLSCDFPLEAKTVQVKIANGQVILSGAVSRLWAKLEIAKAVQNLGGVRRIENRIEIIDE